MGKGKRKPPQVPILNPLYKGATPEAVGRALLRYKLGASNAPEDDNEPRNDRSQPSIWPPHKENDGMKDPHRFGRIHDRQSGSFSLGIGAYMRAGIVWLRKSKGVGCILGLSIMLSGCLTIETTLTVLEDGSVIDHVVIQPKNSLLTLLALPSRLENATGRGSDTAGSRAVQEAERSILLHELSTFGNVCKLADWMYEKVLASQRIPYSAVSVPTDFQFSEIAGTGCSIQIGPYDPRTLPADFAEEVLGIRIERATGVHEPYRIIFVSLDEALSDSPFSASMDATELSAICSGELDPALCQRELRILMFLIKSSYIEGEKWDELRDILSDPGMLGGSAEMLRMVLKSMPATLWIPDNTAVGSVQATSAFEFESGFEFEYGQGWIWRGSAMEWITASTNPGISVHVRPTRHPTPSTR